MRFHTKRKHMIDYLFPIALFLYLPFLRLQYFFLLLEFISLLLKILP